MRETKTLHLRIKATGITTNDAGQQFGQIECYGAIFDNIDEGNDKILKGAFTRTIQGSKARSKARQTKYVLPMLWQHDTNELIGGWYDLSEDDTGLLCKGEIALATQRGREYYELAKAGMTDQFSIIYDVPNGGSRYDKSGVRELTELRLYSVDPVTFAMNDSTFMVGVKAMQKKSVCGDTTLPIGARDDTWDSSKAHAQIVKWASDSDGNIDATKMKQVHLQCDGDADKITSYGYAFCYIVNSKPQISVAGVKACAAALSGARGADPGVDADGMKKKIETLYSRINKKYPDDPELTPPWSDSGKSRGIRMQKKNSQPPQKKTLMEHYNDEMCEDLLEDWQDVYVCSLTSAILDALKIGDQPAQDISQALDDFKTLILDKFVAQAVECGLSDYLQNNTYSSSPAEYMMQYGSESRPDYGYGWMSSSRARSRKEGRTFSAANEQAISDHVKNMKSLATAHMKAVHTAADDLATILQGSEAAYGSDPGDADGNQEGKQARTSHRKDDVRTAQNRPSQKSDTGNEEEQIALALANIRQLRVTH